MNANIFAQIKSVKYGGNILLIYLKMEQQNENTLFDFGAFNQRHLWKSP